MSLPLDDQLLIDKRTGIINGLQKVDIEPVLPKKAVSWRAQVTNGRILANIPSDRIAGGTHFSNDQARNAAIGEAIERYSGNYKGGPFIRGSYQELKRKGYKLLDPDRIPLYSTRQYAEKGFPFIPFTKDLKVNWVQGFSLTCKEEVLLPASLVYINYYEGIFANEPPVHFVNYAGIASGPTLEFALKSGLLELIERDATAIWWGCRGQVDAIDIKDHPDLLNSLEAKEKSDIRYTFLPLTTDINIPVIGAMLYDPVRQIACMGFSSRPDPKEALLKAAAETVQSYHLSLDLLDPDSPLWDAVHTGILHQAALHSYRKDRKYVQSFKSDYHDMIDLLHNSQYYLDPDSHQDIRHILDAEEKGMLPEKQSLTSSDIVEALAKHQIECFYADVTTEDVRTAGFTVTRVIAPGLVPNAPAAFPYLAPKRLYEVPHRIGWSEHVLDEHHINLKPIPHS